MGKFIPVDPDRWAELVKAAGERDALVGEVARLKAELTDLKFTADRFKAEVERWESENKLKAVRIEAQILDRLVELKKENSRLLDAGDALAYAARHQMAYETKLEGWRAAKSPTPLP